MSRFLGLSETVTKSQLKQIIKEEVEAALDEFQMPAAAKNISKTDYRNVKGSPEEERKKKCAQAKKDFSYLGSAEYNGIRNQDPLWAEDYRVKAERRYYECFPEHDPNSPESKAAAQQDKMKNTARTGGSTLEEDLYTKE
jgi:hypothetical protein